MKRRFGLFLMLVIAAGPASLAGQAQGAKPDCGTAAVQDANKFPQVDRLVETSNPALPKGSPEVTRVAADIQPCLKVLDKPYRFYHYAEFKKMRETAPSKSDAEIVEQHARLWSEYYWSPHRKGRAGLYTATNPVGSSEFGGDDFYLYRIELPAGTAYFDGTDYATKKDCRFSPESVQVLKSVGCEKIDLMNYLTGTAPQTNPGCIDFLRKTYRALHLRALSYQYDESAVEGCAESDQAFVIFDLNGLPADKIALFRKNTPAGGALRDEALEMEAIAEYLHSSIWPSLKTEAKQKAPAVRTLLKKYILGCGN